MSTSVAVDPVALAEYAFGRPNPELPRHWETPEEILRAIFQPRARVAVKACHASSKTFSAADAILLALMLRGDVVTTAPTWVQVKDVLWAAVHRAIAGGKVPASDWGDVNQTEIRMPSGEFAVGLSTDLGVRFQGHHARDNSFLLLIADEAPGVRPDIFEAWEGISAGGDVRHLLLGNPVISSGFFYDIFAGDSPVWQRFTIDAFDSPNLRGVRLDELLSLSESELDVSDRPYLVDRRWVYNRYYEWGEDHPLWQSRVRGQFPLQADDALLSLAWLEAAATRPVAYDPTLPIQAGVDVAGPGDDETTLCVRQGDAILHMQAWSQADARGPVIAALRPWKDRGLDAVNVDVVGMGHYFALALEDAGLPVVRINVGEAPAGRGERATEQAKAKFVNLRAQVFWNLREWAADGMLSGLTDRTALSQLAGIRYGHDKRGRILIESKDDARKRGVKSPDRAEGVVLAFWQQPQNLVGQALARAISRPRDLTPDQRHDAQQRRLKKVAAGQGWR